MALNSDIPFEHKYYPLPPGLIESNYESIRPSYDIFKDTPCLWACYGKCYHGLRFCAFAHSQYGCNKGSDCTYCHICSKPISFRPSKQRRKMFKTIASNAFSAGIHPCMLIGIHPYLDACLNVPTDPRFHSLIYPEIWWTHPIFNILK